MREFRQPDRAWPPAANPGSWRIAREGLRIEPRQLGPVHLVAGDIDGALDAFGIEEPVLGWPDPARGSPLALRLARDRALVIGGEPVQDGWHASGFATSLVTDAHVAIALEGAKADDVLSRLMADFPHPASPSTLFLIEGMPVILCRRHPEGDTLMLVHYFRFTAFASLLSSIAEDATAGDAARSARTGAVHRERR